MDGMPTEHIRCCIYSCSVWYVQQDVQQDVHQDVLNDVRQDVPTDVKYNVIWIELNCLFKRMSIGGIDGGHLDLCDLVIIIERCGVGRLSWLKCIQFLIIATACST